MRDGVPKLVLERGVLKESPIPVVRVQPDVHGADIGAEFGVSAMEVGKLLRAAGMRTEKGFPTSKALDKGLARSIWDGQGRKNEWHIQKVLAALKAAER